MRPKTFMMNVLLLSLLAVSIPAASYGLSVKVEQKKAVSSGWKANIADLWNKVKEVGSKWKANIIDLWNNARGQGSKKEGANRSFAAGAKVIVYSDLIIMNNGNSVQGIIKEEKSDSYLVKLPLGEVKLKKSDVKEIKRLPPEEACLKIGNKFLESRNFEAAAAEYNKALKFNPDYLPAKNAISTAEKRKLEYESRLKASIEQEEKAREKEKPAETSTINEKPAVKQVMYFISIGDMNIPLKKSYSFHDFGFTVDNNLVINGFVKPEAGPVKSIVSSPAEYAGVRLKDRIVSVNGKSVAGLSPIDVEKIIGSIRYIKLVVERQ